MFWWVELDLFSLECNKVSSSEFLRCLGVLPTKVRLVKAVVFPVVMFGCESWTVKKAEC